MKIKIVYYKSKYIIEPYEENIEKCLRKFCNEIKIDINNLSFLYKGKKIDMKKNPNEFKVKLLIIFAYNLKPINHEKNSVYILCPGCNNLATINKFENEEANILCSKKHIYKDIPLKDFLKKNEEFSKLENCDICGNNENLYGTPLNICSCGKKICHLCLLTHDPTHSSIKFYDKYNSCVIHGLPYVSFCFVCDKNICEKCENDHKDHKIEILKKYIQKVQNKKIIQNAYEIKKLCQKVKAETERFQLIINKVINYYKKNIEGYITLNDNLIYMVNNIGNYQSYQNINNINEFNKSSKTNLEKIYKTLSNGQFAEKLKIFNEFYEYKKNILTIYYKNKFYKKESYKNENNKNDNNNNKNESNKSENNKNKNESNKIDSIVLFNSLKNFNLKIRDEIVLNEKTYIINKKYDESNLPKIRVKLVLEKQEDFCSMFLNCSELLEFDEDEFTNFGTPKKIYSMFDNCENLKNLPDLSFMNVTEVQNFDNIFRACGSLKSLPDISYWQTGNADTMNGIFSGCKSLLYLPDISKWNMSNVGYMDSMFSECESLKSLPNISIWDTSKLQSLTKMFLGCKSLTSFPELTAWNTSSITDMAQVFNEYNDFISPEIKILTKIEDDSFLKSITFKQLLDEIYKDEEDKKTKYNKLCEAFFIISLNKKKDYKKEDNFKQIKNETLENSPEIIFKYPININNRFDLEDLALSCFSSGIYAFIEKKPEEKKKNFMFSFKKNFEKYYLINYFAYKKISLQKYYSEYNVKQGNNINAMETPGINQTSQIPESELKEVKGYAFIPFCFCIISRYAYINPIQICLKSIFSFYSKIISNEDFLVFRELIQFIVNLIPIPPLNKQIKFILPYYFDYITLDCPKFKGYDLLNTNIHSVLYSFLILKDPKATAMIWPLRILLNEKSLIVLGNDEDLITKFCDAFLSLLYPFEWVCTYIPILNDKNIKNIDLSSPFLIGANLSFLNKISKLIQENKNNNDIILFYLHENRNKTSDFYLGSSLNSFSKMNFNDYFDKYVPNFPDNELYWGLVSILKQKNFATANPNDNEGKLIDRLIDRLLQNEAIIHYEEYIAYIEKTKEKKRKPFYLNLSRTYLYKNFIKKNPNLNIDKTEIINKTKTFIEVNTKNNQYFEDILFINKNKKKEIKLDYDLNKINKKYFINPVFSSLENKYENIMALQKSIREKYPGDKTETKIFENDVELNENDFLDFNDKIYLISE